MENDPKDSQKPFLKPLNWNWSCEGTEIHKRIQFLASLSQKFDKFKGRRPLNSHEQWVFRCPIQESIIIP